VRVIVLALLLANILFFGWQYWLGKNEPAAAPDPYEGVPELKLAPAQIPIETSGAEPDAGADDALAAEPSGDVAGGVEGAAAPGPSSGGDLCVRLGRFEDQAAAEAAIIALSKADGFVRADPAIRMREVQGIQVSYWVYLPPFLDRKTANAALTALTQRGIKDAYIVAEGEDRNAISLGLYSEQARARRRADQVGNEGMTARISKLERPRVEYVIDMVLPSLDGIDASGLQELGTGVTLEEIPCNAQGQDVR
jgi:hypothetical protein